MDRHPRDEFELRRSLDRVAATARRLNAGLELRAARLGNMEQITLDRVLPVFDVGLVDPDSLEGQRVLALAVHEELRRLLQTTAEVVAAAADGHVGDLDWNGFLQGVLRAGQYELARVWGPPVDEMVERMRADPAYVDRLWDSNEETGSCPDVDT